MTDTTDPELIQKYDEIYKDENSFWSFIPLDERRSVLGSLPAWDGFEVLEIGCGTGDMAAAIAAAGAKRVDAIDMSFTAIERAVEKYKLPGLQFIKGDFKTFRQQNKSIVSMDYDIVVAIGVLEHLEDPFADLRFIVQHILKPGGLALITCPNFINPRGYVWMTLQLIAGWPMSLTDKHQIHPGDVSEFCEKYGYGLNVVSLDVDWAIGPRLIADFQRRLVVASPEEKDQAEIKIKTFLTWLEKALRYEQPGQYSGANLLYQISRPIDHTIQ